jgi:hypothetical protein
MRPSSYASGNPLAGEVALLDEMRMALEALADKMGERCGDHCSNSCRMCEARNELRLILVRNPPCYCAPLIHSDECWERRQKNQ